MEVFISKFNPDVFCVTESWLNESIPDYLIGVNNFSIFRSDRERKLGGGVCVYVRRNIAVLPFLPSLDLNFVDSLWSVLPDDRIILVCMYIHTSS